MRAAAVGLHLNLTNSVNVDLVLFSIVGLHRVRGKKEAIAQYSG